MAIASVYPTTHIQTAKDDTRYIRAQWRGTAYTDAMICYSNGVLHEACLNNVVVIDRVHVLHATALANERSYLSLNDAQVVLSDLHHATKTTAVYDIFGPFGPIDRPLHSPDEVWFMNADGPFSEWSGNCTTWLTMYARATPLEGATGPTTFEKEPTDVRFTDWPWKRL